MGNSVWLRALASVGVALLASGLLGAPVSATQAASQVSVGEPVSITVHGVPREPVTTVSWGDGHSVRVRGECTRTKARRAPTSCSVTVQHVYVTPGDYTLTRALSGPQKALTRLTVTSVADFDLWRQAMLQRINTVRAAAGVDPLQPCSRLDGIAQGYATVMARQGHYGHTGPSGDTIGARATTGGYTYRVIGENIAKGFPTPEAVQMGWERSPGHYANMVDAAFQHVGFGAAQGPDGVWLWVQNYGNARTANPC